MASLAALELACVLLVLQNAGLHGAVLNCPPPPQVDGAMIEPDDVTRFSSGTSVTYVCDEVDYYQEGDSTITCTVNGTWQGDLPTCNWYCFEPAPVINGKITFPKNEPGTRDFRSGDQAVYTCDAGYILPAPAVRHCMSDGEWDGDPNKYQRCNRPQCPDPGIPANGRRIGNLFYVGDSVQFVCYTGYKMFGSSNRTCKANLRWNGAVPTCDPLDSHCLVPPVPEGGAIIGSTYRVGDKIEYHCQDGFVRLGNAQRTCMEDGEWSGEDVSCDAPAAYDEKEEMTSRLKPGLDRLGLASSSSDDTLRMRGPQPFTGTAMKDLLEHNYGVDFYFVFDNSGSMTKSGFHDCIQFAVALVDKLGVNVDPEAGGTVFGAVSFNRKAKRHFHTVDFTTKEEVKTGLRNINYTGGGTNVVAGLTEVHDNLISMTRIRLTERYQSKTALLVFSDGWFNEGGDPQEIKTKLVEDDEAEIFVIMTSTIADSKDNTKESLSKLATDASSHFFSMKNVSEFRELVPLMLGNPIDYSRCGVAGRTQDLNSIRARIINVNNTDVKDGAWPWMVGLKIWDQTQRPAPKLQCGGTLVADHWVITAAHCFGEILKNYPAKSLDVLTSESRFSVLLGSVVNPTADVDKQTAHSSIQEMEVDKVYIFDKYNKTSFYGDLALLHLKHRVHFTVNMRPVCLPQQGENLYFRENGALRYGWVTGWGHSEARKSSDTLIEYVGTLRQVELPIRHDVTCKNATDKILSEDPQAKINFDNSSMFCAGYTEPVNGTLTIPDACKGDSGGPFVINTVNQETREVRWKLIGLVSDGYGCGQKGAFGLYTRLDKFLGWLKNTMANHK